MARIDRLVTRRDALSLAALSFTTALNRGRECGHETGTQQGQPAQLHYLEVVTTDVETVCTLYSKIYGVTFGTADQNLGGARTARLANGGMLGVRAPMHGGEKLVVRPYVLVKDIEAAVAAAAKSGAEITVPPMTIPSHGRCAIVFQGGIESGLWQV